MGSLVAATNFSIVVSSSLQYEYRKQELSLQCEVVVSPLSKKDTV